MSDWKETVTRKNALKIIQSGETFSIEFVTADIKRKTGGKRIALVSALSHGENHDSYRNGTVGVKPTNSHHSYCVHIPLITHVNKMRVL